MLFLLFRCLLRKGFAKRSDPSHENNKISETLNPKTLNPAIGV